jgi:hypothetical protein
MYRRSILVKADKTTMAKKTTYIRKITKGEVKFTIRAEMDETPVRGNALASGDDAEDRKQEDEIIGRLDAGDVWAWANVTVVARWRSFQGSDNLGACSYASEEDFKTDGYFEDMCNTALADLNATISCTEHELSELHYTAKGKLSKTPVKGFTLHAPSGQYVKRGYTLEACHGEAHSNPHIDHCMVCLDFVWGWTLEKLPG